MPDIEGYHQALKVLISVEIQARFKYTMLSYINE